MERNQPSPREATQSRDDGDTASDLAYSATMTGGPRNRKRGFEPRQFDRYTALRALGAGAMGIVYEAYDEELARLVAVKVLRGKTDSKARGRLMREARAMARLSHPNVVPVFDVGSVDDQVFVAMEMIKGQDLKHWLAESSPSPGEVIEVFAQAGRGLAAAHRAGLVHRDFKPANVLVGDDGRVRVGDFGLARSEASSQGSTVEADADSSTDGEIDFTREGDIVGTPAYMAPEQHAGKSASGSADQFSFCVAMWEGLYGQRPFAGDTLFELEAKKMAEERVPPPAGNDVPAHVHRVLARGLRAEPGARYPSMDELLAELGYEPGAKRRRLLAIVAAVGLVAIAVSGLVAAASQPERCAGMRAQLSGVWDPTVASALEAGFSATGLPFAASSYRRVAEVVDRYADEWVALRTDVCEATHMRGEQSEAMLDLRVSCLDRRRAQLAELIGVIAAGTDAASIAGAPRAIARLERLSSCTGDREALAALQPEPEDPQTRERVAQIRRELDRGDALFKAGQYPQAAEIVRPLASAIDEIGFEPTVAEVYGLLSRIQSRQGDFDGAEESWWRVLQTAAASHDHARVALAWRKLAYLVGFSKKSHESGLAMTRVAAVATAQAGGNAIDRADLESAIGSIHYAKGDHGAALPHHERALEMLERELGQNDPKVGRLVTNIGNIITGQRRYSDAEAYFRRAVGIFESALGADHPDTAKARGNLGQILSRLGRHDEAVAQLERAYAIHAAAGAKPSAADVLYNLGSLAKNRDRYDESVAYYERSLALYREIHGAEHPHVADGIIQVGYAEFYRGNLDRAEALFSEGLEVYNRVHGSEHKYAARHFGRMARVYQGREQYGRAIDAWSKAIELGSKTETNRRRLGLWRMMLAKDIVAHRAKDTNQALAAAKRAIADFVAAGDEEREKQAAQWLAETSGR